MPTPARDIALDTEQILTDARAKALRAVKKSATAANLKNLEAAEKAVRDFQAAKSAEAHPGERRLKNIPDVHAYLTEEKKYKVSERKLYEDKRLIIKQPDGSYLAKDAEDYANRFLPKLDGSDDTEGGLAKIKQQKENELLDEKIQRERRRNKVETGKLILRSRVDQQLAARAAFICSDLDLFGHSQLPEVVEQVLDAKAAPPEVADYIIELKTRLVPEMIAAFLKEKKKWMDRYSQPLQFQAPLASILEEMEEDLEEE